MNKSTKTFIERCIFRIGEGKASFYRVEVSVRNEAGQRRFRRQDAPNLTRARTLREEMKLKLSQQIDAVPAVTLSQFITDEYLPRLVERTRPSTFIRTKSAINANIIPHLGNRLLHTLTAADIDTLIVTTLKPLKGQTKRHVLAHLRDICKVANVTGHLTSNPALNVSRPKLNKAEPLVLKESELVRLLAYLRDNQPVMFYHTFLAAYTLARAGEMRALTWADVDFEGGKISINKTCDPKTGLKDCPKNGEARLVPINPEVRQVLMELKEMTFTTDSDLVLPHWREFAGGEQGKPLKLILAALRMPLIRWHDLRATGITMLLTRGIPHAKIMKISGHKDLASFNIYVRLAGVEVDGVLDDIRLFDQIVGPKRVTQLA